MKLKIWVKIGIVVEKVGYTRGRDVIVVLGG
jgi:hypothetical protein